MPKTETFIQMKLDEAPVPVPIDLISPNPYQPASRFKFAAEVIQKMAASILEHGLLQLPIVRPACRSPDVIGTSGRVNKDESTQQRFYEMGDGWLRLCGYRYLAQEKKLKGYNVIPVIVQELTDRQMADLVLEANTVRQDLTPIDLARFYKKYLEDFHLTQAELARMHNCSQGEIANTLRLLELPEDIQQQIISHDITETHGRALLQLSDKKEQKELATKVIKQNLTVARLDEEVKNRLWNRSLPLYVEKYRSDNPAFNLADCEKCQYRQLIKYLSGEPKPRCLNKECWEEKQQKANKAIYQTEIQKLKNQGITHFFDNGKEAGGFWVQLGYWYLQQLDKPDDCQACPRRAGIFGFEAQYSICCIEKECFEGKIDAKRQADERSLRMEWEKTEKYIQDIFAELDTGSEPALLLTMECLLYSTENPDPVANFIRAFNLFEKEEDVDLEGEADPIPGIMAVIKEKADSKMLAAMLPRLAFEMLRASEPACHSSVGAAGRANQNIELTERILNDFKACSYSEPFKDEGAPGFETDLPTENEIDQAEKEVTDEESENDPLATLQIKTPADQSEMYRLSLNGQTIKSETLKFGILELLQAQGIIPGLRLGGGEEVIKILKGYPESQNRDMLIGILEGKNPKGE